MIVNLSLNVLQKWKLLLEAVLSFESPSPAFPHVELPLRLPPTPTTTHMPVSLLSNLSFRSKIYTTANLVIAQFVALLLACTCGVAAISWFLGGREGLFT